MTDKLPLDLTEWKGQIDKAREARKIVQKWADANLKAYGPDLSKDPDEYGGTLNPNRDFTLVERKKADLFFQRPDVTCVPSPLFDAQPGGPVMLEAHTKILSEKLGEDGVDALALVHSCLFDVLCPNGTGWTVMGYDSVVQEVEVADPVTGEPTIAPVPVYEDCFWKHISPKQGLIPASFKSTKWDDAPFLGYDFEVPIRIAKRNKWVPEDFEGTAPDPELHYAHGLKCSADDRVARCSLIYYKSAIFRDDVIHPLHYTLLVLVEGAKEAAVHKDSPYQTLDERGGLTPDSFLGNIIHPLTIRSLTDSAHVSSDCTIVRPTVNEISKYRGQMIEFRDASIPLRAYNVDTLPTDALDKLLKARIGSFIGLSADAFAGETAIKELPQGNLPRENFMVNDILDNDLSRAMALDAEQAGAESGGDNTATEAQIKQANVNARMGFERNIVLKWYLKGVTKYSTLVQRYLPVEKAAQIVGPQAAQLWDGWRKQVPASLAFTAFPDSQLRNDLAPERKRKLEEYSFFAKDPYINRLELLKNLFPKLGYPNKCLNPQPPEQGPEPTKPGLSMKAEDLNPLLPQFPILVEVLGQVGIKISADAIAKAEAAAMNQLLMNQATAMSTPTGAGSGPKPSTAHPGAVSPTETLSKHAADETGAMQGSGAPAPMGAGGMQ